MGDTSLIGLENFYLCSHWLTEWSHPRSNELELNVQKLLACNRRNVDLNLQEEHNILGDALGDFEEVFLLPLLEVIDEEAARVPIIVRPIEHLELDVGGLTGLHLCMELVLGARCLLGDVSHTRQILQSNSLFFHENVGLEGAPFSLLGQPRQSQVVTKLDSIFPPLLTYSLLLVPHSRTRRQSHLHVLVQHLYR